MSEPGPTVPGFQNDIVKVLAVKGQANRLTENLRSQVALVGQVPVLFTVSIRENIMKGTTCLLSHLDLMSTM
jgi:ABC-type transport system involved in cytochrome bd biosynthesis fused ATPase/permease subunit